jgi:hypothetical protein
MELTSESFDAVQCDGLWQVRVRTADGASVGPVFADVDRRCAVDRATRWLAWQQTHAAKLRDLQEAERLYHRTIARRAFASSSEEAAARAERVDALRRLEQARLALDEVRARRPPY